MDTLGAIVKEIKPNARLVFDRIGCYPLFSVNGENCWIAAKDNGGPRDPGIRQRLVGLAEIHSIPHKLDIYPFYGSDAGAALRAGGDFRVGLLGPGVDASHWFERAQRNALEASARLLLAFLVEA